jgi:hypothetical protein
MLIHGPKDVIALCVTNCLGISPSVSLFSLSLSPLCVCVSVCVREKERERVCVPFFLPFACFSRTYLMRREPMQTGTCQNMGKVLPRDLKAGPWTKHASSFRGCNLQHATFSKSRKHCTLLVIRCWMTRYKKLHLYTLAKYELQAIAWPLTRSAVP